MTDVNQALDKIVNIIKQRYTVDASQQVPMVFVFKGDVVHTIIQLDFESPTRKRLSIEAARKHVRMSGASASVFVSEAWMLSTNDGKLPEGITPSQSERRVEVLICELSAPGHHLTRVFEFNRDWNGNFLGFDEDEWTTKLMADQNAHVKSKFDFFNEAK
jgi:hypothetical protein